MNLFYWNISYRSKYRAKGFYADLGMNTSDFEARMQSPALPMFAQIDPMAEKYYSLSPYGYCAGNPVNLIDPSGMDIFQINENGKLVNRIANSSLDQVVLVDAEGVRLQDSNGNDLTIEFEYGTIDVKVFESEGNDTFEVYTINGDENGTRLFEFLADNFDISTTGRGVEFALAQCGESGENGENFITTSHHNRRNIGSDRLYGEQLKYGYTIRNMFHNHPSGNIDPSYGIRPDGTLVGDIPKAQKVFSETQQIVRYGIYTKGYGYHYYTPNTRVTISNVDNNNNYISIRSPK